MCSTQTGSTRRQTNCGKRSPQPPVELPAAAPSNSLPYPIVLDRTHVNQAFVTLGFDDPVTCEAFLKAARILWGSPAAAPIDSIRADTDRLLAKVKPGELLPQPAPSPADERVGRTDEQIIETFEREIKNDPDAYTRPDECVYQITAKELVRAARTLLDDDRA